MATSDYILSSLRSLRYFKHASFANAPVILRPVFTSKYTPHITNTNAGSIPLDGRLGTRKQPHLPRQKRRKLSSNQKVLMRVNGINRVRPRKWRLHFSSHTTLRSSYGVPKNTQSCVTLFFAELYLNFVIPKSFHLEARM